jgi:hypothetical protein
MCARYIWEMRAYVGDISDIYVYVCVDYQLLADFEMNYHNVLITLYVCMY